MIKLTETREILGFCRRHQKGPICKAAGNSPHQSPPVRAGGRREWKVEKVEKVE
jgi:hypothetical protein